MKTANQNFIIISKDLKTNQKTIYDNGGHGYPYNSGITYIEVGEEPFTIRYTDYDKMFKGTLTVIIQYCESPCEFTIKTIDKKLTSKPVVLGGMPDYQDTGILQIYSR